MNIDELQKSDKIIFSCIAGSHAYGLSVPESDIDLRGIFYNKPEVSLIKPSDQIMDKTNDTVFYSVEEFFKLIMNASPTWLNSYSLMTSIYKYIAQLSNIYIRIGPNS